MQRAKVFFTAASFCGQAANFYNPRDTNHHQPGVRGAIMTRTLLSYFAPAKLSVYQTGVCVCARSCRSNYNHPAAGTSVVLCIHNINAPEFLKGVVARSEGKLKTQMSRRRVPKKHSRHGFWVGLTRKNKCARSRSRSTSFPTFSKGGVGRDCWKMTRVPPRP